MLTFAAVCDLFLLFSALQHVENQVALHFVIAQAIELKQSLEDAEARLQLAEEANLVQSREVSVGLYVRL